MNSHQYWLFIGCFLGLAIPIQAGPTTAPAAVTPTATPAKPMPTPIVPKTGPFAPPAGGWPKDAKVGNVDHVSVDGMDNQNAWFHLAVPKEYSPEKAWPLAIALHGGPGGRGPDDIVAFFRGGYLQRGVISVYPNSLEKILLAWNYPDEGEYLLRIIEQVAKTYHVDPCRIYLTGVSMGGGGTWANGAVLSDVWAAIGPICGWYASTPHPDAKLLREMPIYFMHGEKDSAVPVQLSHMAVEALQKIGRKVLIFHDLPTEKDLANADCVYREIKDAEHACLLPWETRGEPEMTLQMNWMLRQHRPRPADLAAARRSLTAWGQRFHTPTKKTKDQGGEDPNKK